MMMMLKSTILLAMVMIFFAFEQSSAFFVKKISCKNDRKLGLLSTVSDGDMSTSRDFAMDPTSPEAKKILNHLGLTAEQHQKLAKLSVLVVDWNDRINLISRRDCCKEVVFGRHIIPSLAPLGIEDPVIGKDGQNVIDVGTGGGFPGLPLAIAYPNVEFLLVDSVGKKIAAVSDMAKTLGLDNVKTHHGRAEEIKRNDFDVCVGRSVAAIPTYCFWIQNLLKKNEGCLLYLIGGEIERKLLDQASLDQDIDDLLNSPGASDKRVLVFQERFVKEIAASSGEKSRVPTSKRASHGKRNRKKSKGAWTRKENSAPKQRGYEGFQRYDSLND